MQFPTEGAELQLNDPRSFNWAGTNFLLATASVIRGLRHADLAQTDLRVSLIVLECSLARGAVRTRRMTLDEIAQLDGCMDKSQVGKSVRRLKLSEVIDGNQDYSFKPPTVWKTGSRCREGRQAQRDRLEKRFNFIEEQLDLKLWELHAEMQNRFLAMGDMASSNAAGQFDHKSGQADHRRGQGDPARLTTKVVNLTTSAPSHTNVGLRLRSMLRNTSDAQKQEAQRILSSVLQWIEDGEGAEAKRKEENNPIFAAIARMPDWPNPLSIALSDMRASSNATTANRAARLVDYLKRLLGPEKWFELFPRSKASFVME